MQDIKRKEKQNLKAARNGQGILKADTGFTLVELLVAMTISLVVMAAFYQVYSSQSRSYVVHEQVVEVQQNLRAAMFYMTRDIRMAGCDPNDTAGAGFIDPGATTSRIEFTMDVHDGADNDGDGRIDNFNERGNVNGVLGDKDESISYFLSGNNLVRNTASNVIAENIDSLEFEFLDSSGSGVTDVFQIKSVRVTVSAISDDTKHRKTLASLVKCRNL
jgi:type IV pilus assembly protein PilW